MDEKRTKEANDIIIITRLSIKKLLRKPLLHHECNYTSDHIIHRKNTNLQSIFNGELLSQRKGSTLRSRSGKAIFFAVKEEKRKKVWCSEEGILIICCCQTRRQILIDQKFYWLARYAFSVCHNFGWPAWTYPRGRLKNNVKCIIYGHHL